MNPRIEARESGPIHIGWESPRVEVEIGIGKSGRQAYGFDDIAIVPSRRTRDPEDIDISWDIDAFHFDLPLIGAAMDGVVSPKIAIEVGQPAREILADGAVAQQRRHEADANPAAGHRTRGNRRAPSSRPSSPRSPMVGARSNSVRYRPHEISTLCRTR